MKKPALYLVFLMISKLVASAQEIIPLYPNIIPNSKPSTLVEKTERAGNGHLITSNITQPSLTVFLPDTRKANGTAVIICPGGGYFILAAEHEGSDVAKRFTEWGVTAFVLKYRLPSIATMEDPTIGPLQDAQRAIQYVRENAKIWQLEPKQIGIMGFSAGGHLAASAAVHFDQSYIQNTLKTSLRPDFVILAYPVISFNDEIGHKGSRENLLGKEPDPAKVKYFSLETQVTKKTPPVFLMQAKDDKGVKVENTLQFAEALDKVKVKHDMYLYEKGGHGFGLKNPTSDVDWMKYVKEWMFGMDLILKKSSKF